MRVEKGNNIQGVSMGFSLVLNEPCSDERGFTKEVTGSNFADETFELDLLSTTLHDFTN